MIKVNEDKSKLTSILKVSVRCVVGQFVVVISMSILVPVTNKGLCGISVLVHIF